MSTNESGLSSFFNAAATAVGTAVGTFIEGAEGEGGTPPTPPPRPSRSGSSQSQSDLDASIEAARAAAEELRWQRAEEERAAQRRAHAAALAEAHRQRVERMEALLSKRLASIDYVRRTHTADGAAVFREREQPHWLNSVRTPCELREAALGARRGGRSGGNGIGSASPTSSASSTPRDGGWVGAEDDDDDGGGADAASLFTQRERAGLDEQLQRRLRRWFRLCAGIAKLLGLENGLHTLQAASQLFTEYEYWTSTAAVRTMKLMMATTSATGLFPLSEMRIDASPRSGGRERDTPRGGSISRSSSSSTPRGGSVLGDDGNLHRQGSGEGSAAVNAVLFKHRGNVAYTYLPTPRISCGRLDYATVILSLCDVVGQLYSKLGDDECAEIAAFDALLALDKRIQKHIIEAIVVPLKGWAVSSSKRSIISLLSTSRRGAAVDDDHPPSLPSRAAR
tara:strand:- start:104 stop:1459 length:1356 start_codon:yes stop_codon:yes gene_type:complete